MFQGGTLDNSVKLKALKSIIFAIENPEQHTNKLRKKSKFFSSLSWICLFISFLLYFQELTGIYILVIAILSGLLMGFSLYLHSTSKQWPIVAKHVNIDSVISEINEIET